MRQSWFIKHSRPSRAQHRLFCFPYAGGNAQIFRTWADLLPPSVELIAIQAPGKGSRMLEPPCTSVEQLIDQLLTDMQPLLHEKPFSLFGHSNGALVAFELSCVLQERRLPGPQHLFLSASPAPWTRRFERPYSAMDDDEFRGVLQELNGTPPEVLQNRELLDLVLPGLRADFSLAEGYAYSRPYKLSVPTSIYYGEHDEIEEFQIRSWQEQIAPRARFERIPGGHFFIHSHQELLAGLISKQLMASSRTSTSGAATEQEHASEQRSGVHTGWYGARSASYETSMESVT